MTRETWIVKAHAVLQKVEWVDEPRECRAVCPVCGAVKYPTQIYPSHRAHCQLAALLRAVP